MYEETREAQNGLLASRLERAKSYLETLADMAEGERKAAFAQPAGLSTAEYAARVAPLRGRITAMIGYPPPGVPVTVAPVLEEIGADDDGTFFRVTIPLLQEGLDAHGLLICPAHPVAGKALAVAIHGGGGTPELAAELLGSTNYNNMGRRLARRGHTVWMPACFERSTFNEDGSNIDLHRYLDRKARLVGTSVSALDAYIIIQSTTAILALPNIEAQEAIAVGLSYGGFRALLVTALSDIFTACISSCYFNDRRAILDQYSQPVATFDDWIFVNALRLATDIEFCQLICPRPLTIEVGQTDELFPVEGAIKAAAEVQALYAGLGISDRFLFDPFEGVHEFNGVAAFEFLDRMGI